MRQPFCLFGVNLLGTLTLLGLIKTKYIMKITAGWISKIFILCTSIISPIIGYSQITSNGTSPNNAVQNILLGGGVNAFNITSNVNVNNNHNAVRQFNAGATAFPLASGVHLATSGAPNVNDADLASIANGAITNGIVIEFDFIPNGNSVSFNYIFASSEYASYTCTGYNDAFGFFISGPGISGPFSNNSANIALVPGKTVPVAINTVNSGSPTGSGTAANCAAMDPTWQSNSSYFTTAYNSIYSSSAGIVDFNGSTTVLQAFANVQCGEVYHIKLAISNVGDQLFHSGVFLEAGSLSSNFEDPSINSVGNLCVEDGTTQLTTVTSGGTWSGNHINNSGIFNQTAAGIGTHRVYYSTGVAPCFWIDSLDIIVEQCVFCDPVVSNTGPYCPDETIQLNGSGGGAYSWTGPNGFTSNDPNPIIPNATPAMSGDYILTINIDGCVGIAITSVLVHPIPTVNAGQDQTICSGQNVTLTASGNAVSYTWDNSITNGVAFNPISTNTYTVTGITAGGCIATDNVAVNVNPLPVVDAGADFSICVNTPITLSGNGASSYTWTNGVLDGVPFTPTGTTTYTVTGTDTNGCQNTDEISVTVFNQVIIDAGSDFEICEGDSHVISASGGVTYFWDNGLGTGASHTVSPIQTTTYIVDGEDANGCPGTDQVTITVHQNPFTSIVGNSQYCEGTTSMLDAGLGFTSYTWSTGQNTQTINATIANNPITVEVSTIHGCTYQTNPFTLYEIPTIYHAETVDICQGESILIHNQLQTIGGVYEETFLSSNGCDSVATITLVINPLPIVDAGINQNVCSGESVILSGAGATIYEWDNNVVNNIPFTPSIGTVVYTLTGTDNNGCVNESQVSITVNPLPEASITGATEVCLNSQDPVITFTGSNSTAPYTFTYHINGGSNQTITSTGNTITLNAPTDTAGVFTYNLISVQDGSMITCEQQITESIVIIIHDLPNVFAGNDLVICEGETAILSASGASSYVWDNDISNNIPFTVSETTTYTVTGTSIYGCENTDEVVVTAAPNPAASFTGIDLNGCSPVTPTLTNTSSGDLVNCQWSFSNGQTLSGCGDVTSLFTIAGCYDVSLTVTTSDGCSNTTTAVNYICVELHPEANFSAEPSNLSSIDPTTHLINSTTGASSYYWSFGDESNSSSDFSPSHTYPETPGQYTVTLIAYSDNGCTDTAYVTIKITEELIFYVPNAFTPDNNGTNEEFKPIFHSGFDPFNYNLTIFNRWGEVLFESNNVEYGWHGDYGGQEVTNDVYIWKITFKRNGIDKREQHIGHVTLIR